MLRWIMVAATIALVVYGIFALAPMMYPTIRTTDAGLLGVDGPPGDGDVKVVAAGQQKDNAPAGAAAAGGRDNAYSFVSKYLVIPESHIVVMREQEVPAEREGALLYIAVDYDPSKPPQPGDEPFEVTERYIYRELRPGEQAPEWELVEAEKPGESGKTATYRRVRRDEVVDPTKCVIAVKTRKMLYLKEGMEVEKGQLLALVNPELAIDEFGIRMSKHYGARAEHEAAIKTKEEAYERFKTLQRLYAGRVPNVVALEELRGGELTYYRYKSEETSKGQAIKQTLSELSQALTQLRMHEIRSAIGGMVKAVHKHPGEAVKNQDPILKIHGHDRVRVEGRVEVQHVGFLKKGDTVVIEPARTERPARTLSGHVGAVTAVAVTKNRNIVSAGEDKIVRVWKRKDGDFDGVHARLEPAAEVRALACSPAAADDNLLLTGADDGGVRLYDLTDYSKPPRVLSNGHRGAVNSVAFRPDGKWFVTGGADNGVVLWDTATGERVQPFEETKQSHDGHRGEVTSVQFLSPNELITAGTDNYFLYWRLKDDGGVARVVRSEKRSGDVASFGADTKGRHILFDQNKELLVFQVPEPKDQPDGVVASSDRMFRGTLTNGANAKDFATVALFSPDGRLILSESAGGRLQLWRAPTPESRAYELRSLELGGEVATSCGAFVQTLAKDQPADNFVVTGTKGGQVVVWPLPGDKEIQDVLRAKVTRIGEELDTTANQVPVWAEVDNPVVDGSRRLMPGTTATMVYYPAAAVAPKK